MLCEFDCQNLRERAKGFVGFRNSFSIRFLREEKVSPESGGKKDRPRQICRGSPRRAAINEVPLDFCQKCTLSDRKLQSDRGHSAIPLLDLSTVRLNDESVKDWIQSTVFCKH